MKFAEISIIAATILWALGVIGWENCQDVGLFDEKCSNGSTENCVNFCGGRLAMKSVKFCLDRPRMIVKLGSSVSGAVFGDLEYPIKNALYVDGYVNFSGAILPIPPTEICNEMNLPQYCNTTRPRWNFTYLIRNSWKTLVVSITSLSALLGLLKASNYRVQYVVGHS
jgi:hypothetical protein